MSIKKRVILLSFLVLSVAPIINFNSNNKISQTPSAISLPTPLTSLTAPILIYHYVEYVRDEKDTIRKSLSITPYIFIHQIETLKNASYTFITASELIDILDGRMELPQKPILLSFDDGYRDFYTDVFPILKKYRVKAVTYIVSGFLDKPNYMFTWQIKEIAKSRLVEIGAHTVHHVALRGLSPAIARYEIEESKKELEKIINAPIVSFAYPDGSFDNQATEIVREAGLKSAVTVMHGFEVSRENKFSLFRIHPGDKTGNSLLNFLEQK